jgi:hypothetical protein
MPYFKKELESAKIWEVGDYIAVYFIGQSDARTQPRGIEAAYEPPGNEPLSKAFGRQKEK